jgi:hypothetical protein
MNRWKVVGWSAGRPSTGARHDGTAQRRRCPCRSVVFEMESIDPDVLKRLRARDAVPGQAGHLLYVHRQLELRSAWTAPLASISEGFTTALRGSPGGRFR